jgi:hypothetical protein
MKEFFPDLNPRNDLGKIPCREEKIAKLVNTAEIRSDGSIDQGTFENGRQQGM